MGIDKTELQRTIMHYLKERQPRLKKELLMNNEAVYEHLNSKYNVSESTLKKWHNENQDFKNAIEERVTKDLMLHLTNFDE